MEKFEIIATTIFGLEEILASELREIGATDIELLSRAVRFKGDKAMLYKSNLLLRTAVKILKPIHSFFAANEQQLYDNIKKIDWSEYFTYNNTFAIDGATHSDIFNHSKYVALKSKDAIADQFREKYRIRPSVDPANPDMRINVHINDRSVIVSLDSSGSSLGKRNYRLAQSEAPISEVLAAGIIMLSQWGKTCDFIDPMCGSGTFPIEAALLANNIPSGRNRKFGFEKWNDFDEDLWNKIKDEANSKIIHSDVKIFAKDSDKNIMDIAIENAKRAGVQDFIDFESIDFFQTTHTAGKGIVVINPPYGERLKMDDIINFYKDMGSRLKHFYQGCDAWIISANYEALKFFGLRTSRKIKLFNGPMECRLQKYELYQGSKKASKSGAQSTE
ncbi:MAG: DNA methylase [Bacteroidetes bacterium GWC2_33_15]|nr:MAG: DNA methylase [Bacteroidetes bacterium GWA2_33_15]OFX48968.1 MAG: DNA methylase [Bacteroidetes bacterium GWC2_33_15]OFX64768.1 MAG: DNA methylase [Bacteroidetes bacterium GWB2_32_14]OFX68470.1 MAG: DNA methylase [Bacteroidetes bacterium GWD2_33_33]HAN19194.1 RNA methyltransferase [Bacteroidales bacterium]